MPIKIRCPSCNTKINAPDPMAGKQAKCPKCGSGIDVPSPLVIPPSAPVEAIPQYTIQPIPTAELLPPQSQPIVPVFRDQNGNLVTPEMMQQSMELQRRQLELEKRELERRRQEDEEERELRRQEEAAERKSRRRQEREAQPTINIYNSAESHATANATANAKSGTTLYGCLLRIVLLILGFILFMAWVANSTRP